MENLGNEFLSLSQVIFKGTWFLERILIDQTKVEAINRLNPRMLHK